MLEIVNVLHLLLKEVLCGSLSKAIVKLKLFLGGRLLEVRRYSFRPTSWDLEHNR